MWIKISSLRKKRVNFDSKVSLKRAINASMKRIKQIDQDLKNLDYLLKEVRGEDGNGRL